VSHRPVEWEDFLYELKYHDLIEKAPEYNHDINDLEWKFSKK
jgi:hypothetical protein